MARQKKSNREKVEAEFPTFATEVAGLTTDQLNGRIAGLAKELEESETDKEDNEDLENARALAAELTAPYNDVKKAVRAKTRYIVGLLKDRGAA
ncbi:conserved hypothetical protein [Azospirillaceae bacterium]